MTTRRLAQVLGVVCVTVLGIFSIIASSPMPKPGDPPPAAPTLLSLETPNDALGIAFAGVMPTVPAMATAPANYFVLPLLTTTAPIVRAVLRSPSNSTLLVSATDISGGQTVSLPLVPSSSPGPTSGYFQVLNATSDWVIVIRYPNSFQGSKLITTAISDVVGGRSSAPVSFSMSYRGSTLTVAIVTENNDGRVTSNPPGIDCPGVCTFDFLTATSVSLAQGVSTNVTEFTNWEGSCIGTGNTCTVSLLSVGTPQLPVNPAVTAKFRVHVNTAIPPITSCPMPTITGMRWVTEPNCGGVQFATRQCDAMGYFCCGGQGGVVSPRCNGGNLTEVTCMTDRLTGGPVDQMLIQPGGCYVSSP